MENNNSSQTTNYIIVGNKDGLFFDPNSLQRYIAIQGPENSVHKPLFSETLTNSCPVNSSVKTNGEVFIYENGALVQNKIDANCHMQEISLKKPCPLEMSIKAADLDAEFNDNCLFVQDGSGQYIQLTGQRTIFNSNINGVELNINPPKIVPRINSPILFTANDVVDFGIQENVDVMQGAVQPVGNISEAAVNIIEENDKHESLSQIQTAPNISLNNLAKPSASSFKSQSKTKHEYEVKKNESKKIFCEVVKRKHKHKEEKKSVPLVLKIRKVKHKMKRKKPIEDLNDEEWESVKPKRKKSKLVNSVSDCSDWDSSDEETLDATCKRLNTPVNPIAKCCPRICNKKIQRSQLDAAYSHFTELEKLGQGDRYLGNCVHLKITSPQPEDSINDDDDDDDIDAPLSPWPNYDQISEEIANESNGNQLLSDEIKNAINESLKDQESPESVEVIPKPIEKIIPTKPDENFDNYNTLIWTYYIVAKNRQRPVCLKFLLKTLNINEPRIEEIRKRILSGDELDKIRVSPSRSKLCKSWDVASQHLESLPTKPVPYCRMSPPHLYFVKPIDRRTLYHKFCKYHQIVTGSEIVPKIESYRRFLLVNSNIAFPRQKETSCAGCDMSKTQNESRCSNSVPNASDKRKIKKVEVPIKPSKIRTKKPIKNLKRKMVLKKSQRGDVFSLMLSHLNSLPAKIPAGCVLCDRHKFFSPNNTTVQSLYDDYRRYFLKCTNSELGLRFAIYESFFLRNPLFTIAHLDENITECPKCANSVINISSTDSTLGKK